MEPVGKLLMVAGALLFVAGVAVFAIGRLGAGPLPGDIVVRRGSFTVAVPIVTMLVVSIVLTVLANLFFRR